MCLFERGLLTRGTIASVIALVGLLSIAFVGRAMLQPAAPEIAHVESGAIRGSRSEGVLAFKGIPFAQPPIGALRWRAPQPVVPWKDTLDTTEFRPDCMQPVKSGMITNVSEDCLYLNVWRPAASSAHKLPVMIWIYGGGLVTGAASIYPGIGLARQGIVVVSFDYRLGRLGFFAHPGLARESPGDPRGNYGYMDQLAALKWVQRNIAAFGGDPDNVTIAGESAGGGSALVLVTSLMARGLFARAILQSPGIPTARAGILPMRSLGDAETIALKYARAHGIEGRGRAALAALRALPADTLVAGTQDYGNAIFGDSEIRGLSHSIVDGRLVVETPESALLAGKQAHVPVIVGANDYDLAVSLAQGKDELFALFGSFEEQARAFYDPHGATALASLEQNISADRTIVEPSRHFADLVTLAGQPAYFYRFSYVPEALRANVPGALHADEIPFTLDAIDLLLGNAATAADRALARGMSGYWVQFVKTGNPNGGGRPNWPAYDPGRRNVLNFTNTGVRYGADPLRARLDLWNAVWERGSATASAR